MQRRYDEAEPLFQRAIAMTEKTLGPDHPQVARTLAGYAALLRATKRKGEAAKLEQRAKAIASSRRLRDCRWSSDCRLWRSARFRTSGARKVGESGGSRSRSLDSRPGLRSAGVTFFAGMTSRRDRVRVAEDESRRRGRFEGRACLSRQRHCSQIAQRSNAVPTVNPAPTEASSTKSPSLSLPSISASCMARGIVAAVVFPYL